MNVLDDGVLGTDAVFLMNVFDDELLGSGEVGRCETAVGLLACLRSSVDLSVHWKRPTERASKYTDTLFEKPNHGETLGISLESCPEISDSALVT